MKTLLEQITEAAQEVGGPMTGQESIEYLSREKSREVAKGVYYVVLAAVEIGLDRSVIFDKLADMVDDIRAGEKLRVKREESPS
jgi:hypothetical protein